MLFNKQILVVINPEKDAQVALDKAIRISERLDCVITALVRNKHAVPKLLTTLEQKLSVAAMKGIKVALEVSDETNLLRAIIRTQHAKGIGLVVKEPHAASLTDQVFLPDDWKLLRNSRCPVLLVHADNDWDNSPVLLGVNADPADSEHQTLNKRILVTGRFLSEVGSVQLNLVSAYPSMMQNADSEAQVPALLEAQYRAACRRLVADETFPDSQLHIDQGPPELLIPQVAEQIGARLLILGTVARSGLQGVLLGNTAEQILKQVKTDVLVLSASSKPSNKE
ncbi:MAG: universal stress protein [Motiliproteus sp.]